MTTSLPLLLVWVGGLSLVEGAVQLVFSYLSVGIMPDVAVNLVCLWEEVSLVFVRCHLGPPP